MFLKFPRVTYTALIFHFSGVIQGFVYKAMKLHSECLWFWTLKLKSPWLQIHGFRAEFRLFTLLGSEAKSACLQFKASKPFCWVNFPLPVIYWWWKGWVPASCCMNWNRLNAWLKGTMKGRSGGWGHISPDFWPRKEDSMPSLFLLFACNLAWFSSATAVRVFAFSYIILYMILNHMQFTAMLFNVHTCQEQVASVTYYLSIACLFGALIPYSTWQ